MAVLSFSPEYPECWGLISFPLDSEE